MDHTMLIYDFVQVPRSLLVTNAWLVSNGAELVREATGSAEDVVTLGPPRTRADTLVLSMAWSPPPGGPIANVVGELQTARWHATATHLSLSASCDLAVSGAGRRAQELAAQRDAETRIRTFLAALAERVAARTEVPPVPGAERGSIPPWPVESDRT
jgi:hypothetical protein